MSEIIIDDKAKVLCCDNCGETAGVKRFEDKGILCPNCYLWAVHSQGVEVCCELCGYATGEVKTHLIENMFTFSEVDVCDDCYEIAFI